MSTLWPWLFAATVHILALDGVTPGAGLPPHWKVRDVRGQRAPEIAVSQDGEAPLIRLSGAGRAAFFYREMKPRLADAGGALHWSWRVLDAPANSDFASEQHDDSPARVYVVFGTSGLFGGSARVIFYSFGNAEMPGYARASFASDRLHIIRVDGADERGRWRDHTADPFADYRQVWGGTPPAITAVGIMQDTDQTGARAVAELRRLDWVTP